MKTLWGLFPFFFCLPIRAQVSAHVSFCTDGDTCTIQIKENKDKLWMHVRLFGIDAPEVPNKRFKKTGQPFGLKAKEVLNQKIKNKTVKLIQSDIGPYNRPIVEVYLGKENVNLWLVRNGFAEVYSGKTKRLSKAFYYEAEKLAQKEKKGIWSLPNYQSPKAFRKASK